MSTLTKTISTLLAILMSVFFFGKPEGFKPSVTEPVTTETTKITVTAQNKTGLYVGNPRVQGVEKLVDGQWVEVGRYPFHTEEYTLYYPLGVFKETFSFKFIGMGETIDEGEYRVVVTFGIETRLLRLKPDQTAYAYFTVTNK